MMDKIKLNFINRSNDTNNSSVVIFQLNAASDFNETAVAWTVIKNCGILENHPFTYSVNFNLCSGDSDGNFTPQLAAFEGQAFDLVKGVSGDILEISQKLATNPKEVEVRNNLPIGAIDANCYRDGKLLAVKKGIFPGQKAVFEFQPILYIGVVYQIEEGDVMSSVIISQINSQINLLGITNADIVMTGGGSSKSTPEFHFGLENINHNTH
jgi:hypothetical protein